MNDTIRRLTEAAMVDLLIEAGEAGLTTVQVAQSFSYPAPYQQRSNRTSQIARKLAGDGYAEPLGSERSPLYKHQLVHRWRITAAGIAWHHAQLAKAERKLTEDGLWRIRIREAAADREKALAAANEELSALVRDGGLKAVTKAWRRDMVMRLRAVPCSLAEIGTVFGLTRERVRMIEMEGRERSDIDGLRRAAGLPELSRDD